ncbi:MAG: hypothetical protein HY782_16415 [Chloroflexi bacterium]|nr:hypothetical protein [Chloroflexota bacterium]
MAELKHSEQAHIFILKLWQEVLNDEQNHKETEWRGRIQDVHNGETHYFRDWPTIVKFISNIFPELGTRKRHNGKRRAEHALEPKRSISTSRRRTVPRD